MDDAKPAASLSPTLLARKGGARPAMRPQWQPLSNYSTEVPLPPQQHEPLEDLGWNDMGDAGEPDSTVIPFGPGDGPMDTVFAGAPPQVVLQQESLAHSVVEPSEPAPLIPLAKHRYARAEAAAAAKAQDRRSALAEGRRAAFTLRMDNARHLRLRLACTMLGRSAQQLVTEALDRLLGDLPELDDLAKRVKQR